MAILVRHEVSGVAADQFDAAFTLMVDQLPFYPGFLANASGPSDAGYQLTEVWETQEAHERWLREVMTPTLRQSGIDPQLLLPQYLALDRFITR